MDLLAKLQGIAERHARMKTLGVDAIGVTNEKIISPTRAIIDRDGRIIEMPADRMQEPIRMAYRLAGRTNARLEARGTPQGEGQVRRRRESMSPRSVAVALPRRSFSESTP